MQLRLATKPYGNADENKTYTRINDFPYAIGLWRKRRKAQKDGRNR